MNFIIQHIATVIEKYDASVPLAIFLKAYFKEQPKIGSRDRKAISEGVYIYYRSALFVDNSLPLEQQLQQGYLLCESQNSFLGYKLGIDEHVALEDIYAPEIGVKLSEGVDEEAWLKSHWSQPDVFLRIVNNEGLVLELLEKNEIPFEQENIDEITCIRVPNSAPIDKVLFNDDYVIQDRSSQIALLTAKRYWDEPQTIWDVCAGAGGKTILLQQLYQNQLKIVASDIRKTILYNLRARATAYDLKQIKTKIIDSTNPENIAQEINQKFDVVLCDVPCTGSGTWSRTPEQLYFFNAEYFDQFAHLQYPIAKNATPYVKDGGFLVYITCSVFAHENEGVVEQLIANEGLKLVHQEMILGMELGADTLFVAVLQKVKS